MNRPHVLLSILICSLLATSAMAGPLTQKEQDESKQVNESALKELSNTLVTEHPSTINPPPPVLKSPQGMDAAERELMRESLEGRSEPRVLIKLKPTKPATPEELREGIRVDRQATEVLEQSFPLEGQSKPAALPLEPDDGSQPTLSEKGAKAMSTDQERELMKQAVAEQTQQNEAARARATLKRGTFKEAELERFARNFNHWLVFLKSCEAHAHSKSKLKGKWHAFKSELMARKEWLPRGSWHRTSAEMCTHVAEGYERLVKAAHRKSLPEGLESSSDGVVIRLRDCLVNSSNFPTVLGDLISISDKIAASSVGVRDVEGLADEIQGLDPADRELVYRTAVSYLDGKHVRDASKLSAAQREELGDMLTRLTGSFSELNKIGPHLKVKRSHKQFPIREKRTY